MKWDRVWPLIVTSVLGLKKNSISTSSDPARDFRRAITRTAFLFQDIYITGHVPFDSLTALNLPPLNTGHPGLLAS